MLLTIKDVSKKYKKGRNYVLDKIDFTVDCNDFLVVTGSSGSGKSTLLAISGGYLKPTQGSVIFKDNDLYSINDRELSKIHNDKIGYVPQSNIMVKGYNILENIIIPYQFSHRNEALDEIQKRAVKLMNELCIGDLYDRYPYELSGGEQKRVALARALLSEPKLLIADEPTTGLDKKTADIIIRFLSGYSKEGNAVIVATHDELVMEYGNKRLDLTDRTVALS